MKNLVDVLLRPWQFRPRVSFVKDTLRGTQILTLLKPLITLISVRTLTAIQQLTGSPHRLQTILVRVVIPLLPERVIEPTRQPEVEQAPLPERATPWSPAVIRSPWGTRSTWSVLFPTLNR